MVVARLLYHVAWFATLVRAELARWTFGIDGVSKMLYGCPQPFVSKLLRRYGARVGASSVLNSPLVLHNADRDYSHLTIGEGCHVGRLVFLDLTRPIEVADEATVSMGTTILTHQHVGRSSLAEKGYPPKAAEVRIGPGAYLGAGAIILAGVEVGACAIVAAGSVVLSDVPAYHVVAGVPARVVKRISPTPKIE